jgi:hypothetical protein
MMHKTDTKDCDFCTTQPVTWRFPCSPFSIKEATSTMAYRGDWAACETCKPLVEEARWDELMERAGGPNLEALGATGLPDELRQVVLGSMRRGWEKFAKNRRGPAVPVAPTDVFPDPVIRLGRR